MLYVLCVSESCAGILLAFDH